MSQRQRSKSTILYLSVLFLSSFFSTHTIAQKVLATGLCKFSTEVQNIIKNEGYATQIIGFKDINDKTLADKDILALFNLRQTWDGNPYFSNEQAQAIVDFVAKGGALYLSARKSYEPILSLLGVQVTGKDGGASGREWEVILPKIAVFEPHPLTENLTEIVGDVSADFQVDKHWKVLGRNATDKPLLVERTWGLGKVILVAGERIFKNIELTNNRYETDITKGSNTQYHINLFKYLKSNGESQNLNTMDMELPENHFTIFPNPTSHSITIAGETAMQYVEVLNINGQVLMQIQTQEQKQIEIDLSTLPQGMYLIKIQTKTNSYTKEVTFF